MNLLPKYRQLRVRGASTRLGLPLHAVGPKGPSSVPELLGERGQATVEALLMGILSFILVLGLVYQFHDGFRDYADNYFGNYLVCLLETGELPALGGEGGGVCSEQLQEFQLGQEGPGLAGGSLGGGSEGDGRGGGAGSGPAGGSGARGSDPGGRAGGAGGRGGSAFTFRPNERPDRQLDGPAQGQQQPESGETLGGGGQLVDDASRGRIGRRRSPRDGAITVKGAEGSVEARRQAERERPTVQQTSSKENENALRAEKLNFDPRRLASEPEEEPGLSLGFGGYFRFFLILLIVVAIVVFVGSQALQIVKSRDA